MIRQETYFGPFSIISMFGFFIDARIGRTGKEEERAMFQQMQAMAQKQVNTRKTLISVWFLLNFIADYDPELELALELIRKLRMSVYS